MNVLLEKTLYILDTMGQREMARLSGIPQSSISFFVSGQRGLPEIYNYALEKIYRSTAYNNLRETGLSSYESRIWSVKTPDIVTWAENEMNKKVDFLTSGNIAREVAYNNVEIGSERFNELWDTYTDKIRNTLSKSSRPLQSILDLGTPDDDKIKYSQ